MDGRGVDKFFHLLNQSLKGAIQDKIKIILTGAQAGNLLGGNRPSMDIDFAICCKKSCLKDVEMAIEEVANITGIAANFSEDIDRWSQITFLDYKSHAMPYKKFGIIEVTILEPRYWSIGKIARYLDIDIDDLVRVLKKNRVLATELALLWARALLKSPRSSASFEFITHAEHFFKTYGRSIWGRGFDADRDVEVFYKQLGIKKKK